jgi:predicted metalloprotease with PDZ domain
MTHEMFHLSQPDVDDSYHWISEGMADYLEPVSRARLGQIKVEQFWRDLVQGMPQGLPQEGDGGLDHTHTWGRTYWGGSLFWLLADIRVRQETRNTKSVRDAAGAVLNAGGDGSQDWELDRLLKAYDSGTGTRVFETLHDQMGDKAVHTDLDALWKSLGVMYNASDETIRFDDKAPLADIRRGITSK